MELLYSCIFLPCICLINVEALPSEILRPSNSFKTRRRRSSVHLLLCSTNLMIHTSLLCFATFLLLLSHAPFVPADPILTRCYDAAGNYTSASQFETNLRDTLLPSVAASAPLNLSTYSYSSAGRAPDRVFGFAQCLKASTAQACADCLNQSVEAITRLCPNRNQAVVRYDDCVLRYSDQTFLSQQDASY